MKTEILEKEITRFLSIVRLNAEQKMREDPKFITLLTQQLEYLDEDLLLLLKVFKSTNALDILKLLVDTRMMKH